jgi:hypothetical protein
MAARLADRLNAMRQRQFVGRSDELALFQSALEAPELPFYVLHVVGPGGVGKTTLLGEFALLCEARDVPALRLDARAVDPTPEALAGVVQRRMPGLLDSPAADSPRLQVLMIDTYELLAPLDGWLRDSFLPQLPANTLVVLAGREPPALPWRADSGWRHLLRVLPLRNLSRDEGQSYLAARAVPEEQRGAVLAFTHGHPLALSLVADVFSMRPHARFDPEAAPDIIRTLLEQFVQKVPGPAHRAALELCALVRLCTEGLLSELLGFADAHELFAWLRGLSFIESSAQGLFPHDLVREALDADLRWRNPDWYAELHRRARAYYAARLHQGASAQQHRTLADYIFLHRNNPVVRPFFAWQESGSMLPEPARDADWPAIRAMVARHEGEESARIAERWRELQPEALLVVRDASGGVAGLLMRLALEQASEAERAADPAAAAAWQYLARHAPLRPGESAPHFRFWMAADTYQGVSVVQSLIFINAVRHYLSTPGLAFHFFTCADPDFWAPPFTYANLQRLPEADFAVGGRAYGVFGHDWRVVPPLRWLELLAEHELATDASALPPPERAAPLVVLSSDDFAAAVRDALHGYARPDTLRDNPLLRSRLVVERAGSAAGTKARIDALRALITETCDQLKASPHDLKGYRALYHTYLAPAASQELAAELLHLPFSTFRRHLKNGIGRVAELLWLRELHHTST